MSVGPRPRMKAGRPSVRQTVRTQSRVDLYFCPSAAEKPSVCIRDLIMSMGYMTAQSYSTRHSLSNLMSEKDSQSCTHCVSCSSAEKHSVRRVDLVASDAFLRHLALHQFLIRPEVDAVSDSLAPQRDDLALIDARDTVLAVDLLHGVKRPGVHGIRRGLRLQSWKGARS